MRNLQAKIIKGPRYKLQVVRPKKGKGSYKRKGRVKRPFSLFCCRQSVQSSACTPESLDSLLSPVRGADTWSAIRELCPGENLPFHSCHIHGCAAGTFLQKET